MNQLVRTEIEEYAPVFNEDTGEYTDACPYEKYTRGQQSVYTCRCISGRTLNNRQQFIQHFKTKAHGNWMKHLGKDENIKLIKELRIENAKKDNKLRMQARHLKRQQQRIALLENEVTESKKASDNIIKYKNDVITELQENVQLLEETTGASIEYEGDDAWEVSTVGSASVGSASVGTINTSGDTC
jgi:hypothetical protein|tara:strand:+ start:65 stop:622 length:558 start_codon:yes stop_codon:yes gene_type:complete